MKKGDFIRIDYVGRIEATGEIFDLTSAEVAKKEGIHSESQKYGPQLVVVGAGMVVKGIEERIVEMKPGDQREFVLKPTDAFGRRDPSLIKIMSRGSFMNQKINPVPGAFVTINGKQAKIRNVTGGRIRVDFNHPLAGKELRYKLRIVEKIGGTLEKAKALIKFYGIPAKTSLEDGKLHIKTVTPMPEIVAKLIDSKMKEWIKEIKEIKFHSEKKKGEGEEGKKDEPKLPPVEMERPEGE